MTHGEKMASIEARVASSGKFWTKRILLGGKYSSGTWTIRFPGAAAPAAPAPAVASAPAAAFLAAQRFARSLRYTGLFFLVCSVRRCQ